MMSSRSMSRARLSPRRAAKNVDLMIVTSRSRGVRRIEALQSGAFARVARGISLSSLSLIATIGRRFFAALNSASTTTLSRPVDRNELLARARTNVRQKRYVDRLRQSVRQSVEMAFYDPLTGLNNRRFLERRLPAMIETARQRGAPLTMMIFDIDHFKRINDTFGHDAGDLVLKGFAAELQQMVRGGDLVCRLGGEEFVVAMPGLDASHAARMAERARRTHRKQGVPYWRRRRAGFDNCLDRPRRYSRRTGLRRSLSPRRPRALPLEVRGPQSRHSGCGVISWDGPDAARRNLLQKIRNSDKLA